MIKSVKLSTEDKMGTIEGKSAKLSTEVEMGIIEEKLAKPDGDTTMQSQHVKDPPRRSVFRTDGKTGRVSGHFKTSAPNDPN